MGGGDLVYMDGDAVSIFPVGKRLVISFVGVVALLCMGVATKLPAEVIDYHQHLFSPEASARDSLGPQGIDADYLIKQMDAAGIRRAVVLSVAYTFSNPNKPAVADEYAHVKAENDWTSAQVARYPDRLIGFCSVNPLKEYAVAEIARCAKDPHMRTGLKLHFGNSDVNLADPEDLAKVQRVFRAANQRGMAITVHMHANISHHRPYGTKQARIFLEQLLPEAPDVPVQIAHLAGAGGYDQGTDEAQMVFIEAIERNDPRMKNVYFDVCGIASPGQWESRAGLIVDRIRRIGVRRIFYGSDAPTPANLPKAALEQWHQLPLTQEEFRQIDNNVAPYIAKWVAATKP
jgi:predicted TIM-barrel fold metal-dependent hydrolase